MIIGKVFKLDQGLLPPVAGSNHKFVHQLVVFIPRGFLMLFAEIEHISKQLLVIGSHIKYYRKSPGRIYACTRNVKGQFSNGNPHPVCPQITKPQTSASVGNHNYVHFLLRPVVDCFPETTLQ